MEPGTSRDTLWALGWLGGVTVVAAVLLIVLVGPQGVATGGTGHVAAVLAFVGVLVTAAAAVIGLTVTRQSSRAEDRRLRLDAAMRAGDSFSRPSPETVGAASVASSLLALTKLGHADLAVALLVDFWSPGIDAKVAPETAILVVDAALRSGKPSAELVAAELLCRNARRLDPCQSLHWPSCIDGCWNPGFGPKTKLLIVDALTLMTKAKAPVTEAALRSVAVRLYGIFDGDPDENVRGCIATLIRALLPALREPSLKQVRWSSHRVVAQRQVWQPLQTWRRWQRGQLQWVRLGVGQLCRTTNEEIRMVRMRPAHGDRVADLRMIADAVEVTCN